MKISKQVLLAGSILISALAGSGAHATATTVEVYKSSTCKCCAKWVDHMRANGFTVNTHDVGNKEAREQAGISTTLGSCHTALVDGYAIEGHVPAQDIKRLLKERPRAIGLTAPGMPHGSPGMEGARSDPYDVLLINKQGDTTVYSQHRPSDAKDSVMRLK
ncbi:Uncharacterized conserved protein [Nitrosospira sp. Nsp11]|jgi:hypothetical protein|uniref:DUF411 domain-containing protein n=1 Tax=unclassified Nitrosospira TaxID=2609267 RepID=UPI00088DCBB5|nr:MULTISPECIES: DUF411 domain-containing protein [unclassified Nitrosospira]SDA21339.1 Uncharacterized conserved protein [Nitrosospira sp. Nsp18]SHL20432.1 Uncharacterized conserved protein [Nitrosospira sp. Nsp11]